VSLVTIGGEMTAGGTGGTGCKHVVSVDVDPATHAAVPTETIAVVAALVDDPLVLAKPVPVMVISVPPGPVFGNTEVMLGAAAAL
jgi:hypothetical protein